MLIFRESRPAKAWRADQEAVFSDKSSDKSRRTQGRGWAAGRCRAPECPAGGRAFSQRSSQTSCAASWLVSLASWPASGRPPPRSSTAPPSAQTRELHLYCSTTQESGQGRQQRSTRKYAQLMVMRERARSLKSYVQDGGAFEADVGDRSVHHHHLSVKHLWVHLQQTEHGNATRAWVIEDSVY